MRTLRFAGRLDLPRTLRPMRGDPTVRVGARELWRATRTPEGPATLHVVCEEAGVAQARAFGPGARFALETAADELGLGDTPPAPPAHPPALRAAARRAPGVRLARTRRVLELLVPIVLQQLVSGKESERALRRLVRACSEPAPGPGPELWLPPAAQALAGLPPAAFPPLGITARQGATLRGLGQHATRLEACAALPTREAARRLAALPGLGPWSVGVALLYGFAAADVVPIGDWNLPSVVAFNLAGERRADDARMLALLEPFRGQRGRVVRWLAAGGHSPPRRGPRHALRPLPHEPGVPRPRL